MTRRIGGGPVVTATSVIRRLPSPERGVNPRPASFRRCAGSSTRFASATVRVPANFTVSAEDGSSGGSSKGCSGASRARDSCGSPVRRSRRTDASFRSNASRSLRTDDGPAARTSRPSRSRTTRAGRPRRGGGARKLAKPARPPEGDQTKGDRRGRASGRGSPSVASRRSAEARHSRVPHPDRQDPGGPRRGAADDGRRAPARFGHGAETGGALRRPTPEDREGAERSVVGAELGPRGHLEDLDSLCGASADDVADGAWVGLDEGQDIGVGLRPRAEGRGGR